MIEMKILNEYGKIALLSTESEEDLDYAAELIKSGELVGIPTETVYGLAADALNPKAVKKIYEAKGRPSDNPLIDLQKNSGAVRLLWFCQKMTAYLMKRQADLKRWE